ncbi:pseudouridine synthase [Candidatus Woesearchaeota archaeon]|nr:pseudouridine synthase [Candidatus Woesearchaeota archaeon]
MEQHRVQKLLSNYGYCSRRKAEEFIEKGRVKVNDKKISLGDKATERDKIYVDDKLVEAEKKVYLMFNKPLNCVTALKDPVFDTVMDHIDIDERVFPVGRLDYNTSGLLILTNDGDFANRIMHPRYETKKTYLVGLRGNIPDEKIMQLEEGVMLKDGKTRPAKVVRTENALEITIHEGKNRIIRRMFEKIDVPIKFLQRIRIGNLSLGKLKQGKYKFLDKKELKKLTKRF